MLTQEQANEIIRVLKRKTCGTIPEVFQLPEESNRGFDLLNVIVPINNSNSHSYTIGVPVIIVCVYNYKGEETATLKNATIGKAINEWGHVGNFIYRSVPDEYRYATAKEIDNLPLRQLEAIARFYYGPYKGNNYVES